jgi:uncharacterized BrkB/YihY/UPF0761 family membrane protein
MEATFPRIESAFSAVVGLMVWTYWLAVILNTAEEVHSGPSD